MMTRVARADVHLLMLGKRHAVERGHALALAAGGKDDELVVAARSRCVSCPQECRPAPSCSRAPSQSFTTFSMLRPVMPTLRLYLTARSMICRMRCTFEANVVTMMRLSQSLKSWSKRSCDLALGKRSGRGVPRSWSRTSSASTPSSPQLAEAREIGHLALAGA